MSLRSKLAAMAFVFCSSQQVHAQGLDLTPVLLGCLMSEGSSCVNTGWDMIDSFFGNVDVDTDTEYNSADFRKWYYGPYGNWWNKEGYSDCRRLKEQGFLKKTGWIEANSRLGDYEKQKASYLEFHRWQNGVNIFECTDSQREIYRKKLLKKFKVQE